MTTPQKTTMIGLVSLALAITVSDVWLLLDGEEGNTISSVVQGQAWLAGPIGYVAVHLARKPTEKSITTSWWWVGGGAILAGVGGAAIGGGIFGLLLGGAVGWATWGNSGKT